MRILAILAVPLLLSGCASTRKVSRELMVMNEPGIFSLRIGSLEDISHRRRGIGAASRRFESYPPRHQP